MFRLKVQGFQQSKAIDLNLIAKKLIKKTVLYFKDSQGIDGCVTITCGKDGEQDTSVFCVFKKYFILHSLQCPLFYFQKKAEFFALCPGQLGDAPLQAASSSKFILIFDKARYFVL